MQYDGGNGDGRRRLERGRQAAFPVGASLQLDGDTVVAKVLRSGSPQRVERYEEAGGTLAQTVRSFGYRAAVAAPVTVGGRLWGVLVAATASDEPPRGPRAAAVRLRRARRAGAGQRRRLREAGRIAGAPRGGRRRRAHAARAQPARRRSAAARLGRARAQRRRARSSRATRRSRARFWPRPRRTSRAGSPSCASWRAGSIPPCSRSAGWALRSTRSLARAPIPVEIAELPERPAPPAGRGGGVLRRRGGDHERRQVRARVARDGQGQLRQRRGHGDGLR